MMPVSIAVNSARICFNAKNTKASADKVDRRSHAREATSDHREVYLV